MPEPIAIDDAMTDISGQWNASNVIKPTFVTVNGCLLYTSPSPRDGLLSRMPSSA